MSLITQWPRFESSSSVRLAAILLLAVGVLLGCAASLTSTNPDVRIKALRDIMDQNVLATVALEDENARVRLAAVEKLNDQNLLGRVAMESADGSVRHAAVQRLVDQSLLAKIATESQHPSLRISATKRLTDQNVLARVVRENRSREMWKVRQAAFGKLDQESLAALARRAEAPALSLAAKIRRGEANWDQAFASANKRRRGLGDVLGAAALVESPRPTSAAVVAACHDYIRRGDVARIAELRELLLRYGNKTLAEDYLNCGRHELEEAGKEWARANGYNVGTGFGSSRVRWGSGR